MMAKPIFRPETGWLLAVTLLAMAGCATPVATSDTNELPFEQAVAVATDGLVRQIQSMPGFLAKMEAKITRKGVVIDPVIDAGSGQQTVVTKQLEQRVTDRLRSQYDQFEIMPFQPVNLGKAQYLLTGTMARVERAGVSNAFDIRLALVDLKSGIVAAQSSARARSQGLDTTPTPYYRDSPILVKDKVVEGYVSTSGTPPGQPADPNYFGRITTAALVNDATAAYDGERYEEALNLYKNAAASPSGEQLRVLNGIYLSNWKLGKTADAEQAFGAVVGFGIANGNLGIKFLFNPGSTEFWSDPKVSGPYALWLRQIARQADTAKVCLNVVGHTSRTGSEQVNDRLSQQRAAYIKQRLDAEAPELSTRTRAAGVGFRENIVGSGTDDMRDALDRRVEFKIGKC